ncbi:di-trans,poly-cis-decaprenylcistransferase [Patescibacteria group bacterium]|nr:di-trans,poly-cis-decaprenylcistransferase [Patescibacteria group bacterium]MBU4022961.1 di-trans,poly-cis-decaprenylcistransferase [Patescibacteria group bacterium]MBU4078088.1 di-trans,poly-cis-decaprenylcistransferase [Patescibacteria group bacterium]
MNLPYHIGIIMDGNRRWAKDKGLGSLAGHQKGFETFEKIARYCQKKGIKILTVFAFSTENWNRSKKEKDYLMKIFLSVFRKERIDELMKEKVKINVLGQKYRFSKQLQKKIQEIEDLTKDNTKFILNICLSYGGRADIIEAIKKIGEKKITEDLISKNLWTQGLPDPDLIIRTGKEKRISNFLIWQAAYAELYFSDKHWPEFTEHDLDKALKEYDERKRRFGK